MSPGSPSHLILSVGTQVVTLTDLKNTAGDTVIPKGSVGVVEAAPWDNFHSYRVRFPDGREGMFLRRELAIRKHWQKEGLEPPDRLGEYDLRRHVIYRCVVGSRAYGLASEESDTDIRGIYLPPADLHWSLYGVPEQLEEPDKDEVYWELHKFLLLALKANPNVLECLYTPQVELAAPVARELLEMRDAFLSKLIYQTYNGYVLSQFKKMEQDIRTQGGIKWKHAMHLIRLLLAGIRILREGFVPVEVGAHRERLLAIREGLIPWEDVNIWRLELQREFEAAFLETKLPERPDYERVNAYLVRVRSTAAHLP